MTQLSSFNAFSNSLFNSGKLGFLSTTLINALSEDGGQCNAAIGEPPAFGRKRRDSPVRPRQNR